MEETLTCSQCSKKWKRLKTRGRKPIVCPSCVASNVEPPQQIQKNTSPVDQPKLEKKPKNPERSLIASVYQSLYPAPKTNSDQLKDQGPQGSVWKCTHCNYVLKIGVILSDIPTHRCSEHSVRIRELQRIS